MLAEGFLVDCRSHRLAVERREFYYAVLGFLVETEYLAEVEACERVDSAKLLLFWLLRVEFEKAFLQFACFVRVDVVFEFVVEVPDQAQDLLVARTEYFLAQLIVLEYRHI